MQLNAHVKTPNGVTKSFPCMSGVQQGSLLSPFLFNLFLNSLSQQLNSPGMQKIQLGNAYINHLLYADDLALISDTVFGLQRQLNILADYCEAWGLTVNIEKTNIIVFRGGGCLKRYGKWYYLGEQIDTVNTFKYLEVTFNSSGSWLKTQEYLSIQAKKALFGFKNIANKFGRLPPDVMCKIFDSKIAPILLYGCEMWGTCESMLIERVHLRFCRYLLSVPKTTSNDGVRGELGRYPLFIQTVLRVFKYWFHILDLNQDRLLFKCYEFQHDKAERGQECWALTVKNILFSMGFRHVWITQGVANQQAFISLFKQRCTDVELQRFTESISTNAKLNYYAIFKTEFICEKYLFVIENYILKILMTKLRLGILNLEVVLGRYEGIPREERFCKLCDSGLVEDEMHFVLVCNYFMNERQSFIPRYYREHPSEFKFCQLLQCSENSILTNLSKFLFHACKKRDMFFRQ